MGKKLIYLNKGVKESRLACNKAGEPLYFQTCTGIVGGGFVAYAPT